MQTTLFGRGEPALRAPVVGATRTDLGSGAWVEVIPGFVAGQDVLFRRLREGTEWTAQRREMYGRIVDVPRLLGTLSAPVPVLDQAIRTFEERYQWSLDRVSLALYRDGKDSVAWHGDRMGELKDDCVIAILSLGSPRRFLLRPANGGPSRVIPIRGGDLVVLGGTAQRTWEHSVPKARVDGARIAVMFRPSARPASPK